MEGYADRPALGQRAVEYVTDAAAAPPPSCCPASTPSATASCGSASRPSPPHCATSPSRPATAIAILGFTSVDYTVVDIATTQLGAVSVPLQTSAPQAQLQPIVAETEPVVIASSIDYVDDAVELILTGPAPARLVVFDFQPEVDDQREALDAAKARLQGTSVVVETLADVLARGRDAAGAAVGRRRRATIRSSLLVYTSGSTGAPKGAMYPESKVANMWRSAANTHWDEQPGRAARDHAGLPADEPRDGPRRPLRHAGQRRHRRTSPPAATCPPSSRTWRWSGPRR